VTLGSEDGYIRASSPAFLVLRRHHVGITEFAELPDLVRNIHRCCVALFATVGRRRWRLIRLEDL
jgi:hypothetical protein